MTLSEALESPARVLRQLLINQGLIGNETASNWASYWGSLPATGGPNNAASFQDAGGDDEGALARTGENYFHRSVTLVTRSVSDGIAWPKGRAIEDFLRKVGRSAALGGVGVIGVTVGGRPFVINSAKVTVPNMPISTEAMTNRKIYVMTIKVVIYEVVTTTSSTTTTTTSTTP